MITQLKFQNFKALKSAEIKLGAFNVIVGPNGSGKSSVLQGLEILGNPNSIDHLKSVTAGLTTDEIKISATTKVKDLAIQAGIAVKPNGNRIYIAGDEKDEKLLPEMIFRDVRSRQEKGLSKQQAIDAALRQHEQNMVHIRNEQSTISNPSSIVRPLFENIKIFALEASTLWHAVDSRSVSQLNKDGRNLAGALTHLRDKDDDAYNRLRAEFQRWIPEYDSIGFENDQNGSRNITLRQRVSRQVIPASQASEGTLLALALLTIVHQPTPPVLIGLEEPDRGLHPRLLRELRDALYRLAFPNDFGIKRAPVQVVVTTHSPFFLDLFKDHPEQVIIAEKNADGTATFKNLSEDKELRELIGDAPLGEVWYSGVLGGVPVPA